jgi:hypothetical protein
MPAIVKLILPRLVPVRGPALRSRERDAGSWPFGHDPSRKIILDLSPEAVGPACRVAMLTLLRLRFLVTAVRLLLS